MGEKKQYKSSSESGGGDDDNIIYLGDDGGGGGGVVKEKNDADDFYECRTCEFPAAASSPRSITTRSRPSPYSMCNILHGAAVGNGHGWAHTVHV